MGPTKWQQFRRIQQFKQDSRATIDGINFASVVAEYLYPTTLRYWFKILAFSFLFRTHAESRTGRRDAPMIFYSLRYKNRRDYDYIIDQIVELAPDSFGYAEITERLSISQWWRTTHSLPAAWSTSKGYPAHVVQRLAAAFLIAKFRSSALTSLRDLVEGRSRVVTFCDASPHENLVAQLAQLRGTFTITIQHGQYRILDERNMSSDAEAYANFVSDRMLVWGEATCAEFVKAHVPRSRLYVTGWIRRSGEFDGRRSVRGVFGILLNGESGWDSNLALLDTAEVVSKSLCIPYVVRLHPHSPSRKYRRYVGARCLAMKQFMLNEYIEEVDFSIGHMSSAVIEMINLAAPVYVLDDGRLPEVFKVPGLSFAGASDLIQAIGDETSGRGCNNILRTQLRQWFNDDRNQRERILTGIFR